MGKKLIKKEKNPDAVALGRLGGLKGGKARSEKLSHERKKEIAKKAADSRWGNNKKKDNMTVKENNNVIEFASDDFIYVDDIKPLDIQQVDFEPISIDSIDLNKKMEDDDKSVINSNDNDAERQHKVDALKKIKDISVSKVHLDPLQKKQLMLRMHKDDRKVLSDKIVSILDVELDIKFTRGQNSGYSRGKITENATGLWLKFPNEIIASQAAEVLRKKRYTVYQNITELNIDLFAKPENAIKKEETLTKNITELKTEENEILSRVEHLKNKPILDSDLSETDILRKIYKRLIDCDLGIIDFSSRPTISSNGSLSFPTIDEELFLLINNGVGIYE